MSELLTRKSDFEERFWSKVDKGDDDECWEWLAFKDYEGYGSFSVTTGVTRAEARETGERRNYNERAHRMAFWLWYGWWPEVCRHYVCDNPGCCNPYHLRDGTWSENNKDTFDSGRNKTNRGPDGRFNAYYGVVEYANE